MRILSPFAGRPVLMLAYYASTIVPVALPTETPTPLSVAVMYALVIVAIGYVLVLFIDETLGHKQKKR